MLGLALLLSRMGTLRAILPCSFYCLLPYDRGHISTCLTVLEPHGASTTFRYCWVYLRSLCWISYSGQRAVWFLDNCCQKYAWGDLSFPALSAVLGIEPGPCTSRRALSLSCSSSPHSLLLTVHLGCPKVSTKRDSQRVAWMGHLCCCTCLPPIIPALRKLWCYLGTYSKLACTDHSSAEQAS